MVFKMLTIYSYNKIVSIFTYRFKINNKDVMNKEEYVVEKKNLLFGKSNITLLSQHHIIYYDLYLPKLQRTMFCMLKIGKALRKRNINPLEELDF